MWAEIDNGKRHRVNQNIVCFGVAFWRNEFIGKTLHVSRWAEVIVFASQFRAIRQFHNLASFVKVKAAFTSVANRQLNTRGHKRARMDVVDKEQQKNTFVSVRRPSSPLLKIIETNLSIPFNFIVVRAAPSYQNRGSGVNASLMRED